MNAAANFESAAEIGFTEPSPWSQSVPATASVPETPAPTAQAIAQHTADALPVMAGMGKASVSPVIKPLRSPKKLTSLAAVQLPTFQRAKAGSFRR
ncbi:MAG: hypothetical protein HC800_15800 [Phormidesmis sp. RL_2_1]|nr:hypothetical protein [Phormidesmis sp. RL_2_1]